MARKKPNPVTLDEALEIAKKKFPEKYQEFDFGGRWGRQMVDVNSVKRAAHASWLLNGQK